MQLPEGNSGLLSPGLKPDSSLCCCDYGAGDFQPLGERCGLGVPTLPGTGFTVMGLLDCWTSHKQRVWNLIWRRCSFSLQHLSTVRRPSCCTHPTKYEYGIIWFDHLRCPPAGVIEDFQGYGALLLSAVIFGISMLLAGMASPYCLGSGETATSLAAAAEISFSKMWVLGSQILLPVLFYYADARMHVENSQSFGHLFYVLIALNVTAGILTLWKPRPCLQLCFAAV